MDEKPIPCERGYHACPELEDVFGYYNPTNKIRICEVEMNGINIKHEDKIVTNSITILKEIDYKSIFDIYSPNDSEQMMAAWYMDVEDLSKYLDHHNISVRTIIANRGLDKHLDVLAKDKNSYVRAAVAERGRDKDLDILINDPHVKVVLTVIEQCRPQDLDVFVHSSNPYIRMKVAQQGRYKDLDILVKDKNNDVREIVAEIGRPQDLDILTKDNDENVRAAVAKHGRDFTINLGLIKKVRICEVELDGTIIKSNRKYVSNKITIVKEIDYSIFKVTSKNSYHRMMVVHYGTDEDLDILVTDESSHVRSTVAFQGRTKDLDILVNDDAYVVRAAVAMQGRPQDLNVLVNDDDYIVRMVVATRKHGTDLDVRTIALYKLRKIHNTNQNTN